MKFIQYDPLTGEILGRLFYSDQQNIENLMNIIAITDTEYDSQPELWAKVDLLTRRLERDEETISNNGNRGIPPPGF